jgi:hypothetical protein
MYAALRRAERVISTTHRAVPQNSKAVLAVINMI